jgi:hypothetical protein
MLAERLGHYSSYEEIVHLQYTRQCKYRRSQHDHYIHTAHTFRQPACCQLFDNLVHSSANMSLKCSQHQSICFDYTEGSH